MTSGSESQEPGASAAAGWFDVRLEPEQLSRSRYFRRAAWWVIGEFTPLFWLQDMVPPLRATVVVFRRADGFPLKEFEYDSQPSAAWHLADLQDRLTSTHVFDFCRELGIDIRHMRE